MKTMEMADARFRAIWRVTTPLEWAIHLTKLYRALQMVSLCYLDNKQSVNVFAFVSITNGPTPFILQYIGPSETNLISHDHKLGIASPKQTFLNATVIC